MNNLSASTLDLLKDFSTEFQSRFRRSVFGSKRAIELLDRIADSREPGAIIHLAPFVIQNDRRLALEISRTIQTLLSCLKPAEMVILDFQMRSHSHSFVRWKLEVSEVDAFEELEGLAWVPLVIASMYRDGFVRERAVKLLAQHISSETLPFVIIRTNDWVENVRVQAVRNLKSILKPEFAGLIIKNLYLLSRLETSRARDRDGILLEALRVLHDPASRADVFSALESSDRIVQRICYRVALSPSANDAIPPLERGLRASDLIVRLDCVSRLSEMEQNEDFRRFVRLALADRHMLIRQRALSLLVELPYAEARDSIYLALSDRSLAIRQTARALVIRIEKVESPSYFAEYYRSLLSQEISRTTANVVLGLGETGSTNDAEIVVPYLAHPRAEVRKAAIRTLAKLSGKAFVSRFFEILTNDTQSVSRAATKAILCFDVAPHNETIWRLFVESTNTHIKINLLLLMKQLPKWKALHRLLLALSDENTVVRDQAREYTANWLRDFNRGNTNADPETLAAVREAFNSVKEKVDPTLARQLEFFCRG